MAKLWITEFGGIAQGLGVEKYQVIQFAAEPAVAEQEITFTTAVQSAAFNAATRLVRLVADADCHVKFGTNPTAVVGSQRLVANTPEWRAVVAGEKLSVYDGTS